MVREEHWLLSRYARQRCVNASLEEPPEVRAEDDTSELGLALDWRALLAIDIWFLHRFCKIKKKQLVLQ